MKIAVFYPDSRYAGWSACQGVGRTLRRMKHEVTEGPIPVGQGEVNEIQLGMLKKALPTIEALKSIDLIILSGTEHIAPWLDAIYGKYEWKQLQTPKANWYHESFTREDYNIDFEEVKWWADEHFFPAVQDAEFHDQEMFAKGRSHWLPFGVDTQMFSPGRGLTLRKVDVSTIKTSYENPKTWPIAFIGMLYDKRQAFLRAVSQHDHPPIRIGNVSIQDLGGYRAEESTMRMAENYRRIGVFFNLPALSRLVVSKVYEVMACGTFLLTPLLPADRGINKNFEGLEDGRHLVCYRSSNLPYVAQLLREWSSPEKEAEREAIARAGCEEVRTNHSLEKRIEVIFEKCAVKEKVA